MTGSGYAKKLKELGFEKFSPEEVRNRVGKFTVHLAEEPERTVNEENRTVPMLAPGEPVFIVMIGMGQIPTLTVAYDDTGQAWKRAGEPVDLAPHGFTNALEFKTPH